MFKFERREQKKTKKGKMIVSNRSIFTIQRIKVEKAMKRHNAPKGKEMEL